MPFQRNASVVVGFLVGAMFVSPLSVGLEAARLRREALEGWKLYVAAVEARRAREVNAARFFVFEGTASAAAERAGLLGGQRIMREMTAVDDRGRPIDVPSAKVQHWRGAVWLPGVRLDALMARLSTEAPPVGREVLQSRVLTRTPPHALKVFLRIERSKIVTVVLDTEHDVRISRHDDTRASSTSVATRIVEVADAGTPSERALPAGEDRGFLWRLNAYWRYHALPGGVLAECESVTLSRSVPFGLQTVAGPIISGVARESMDRALDGLLEQARLAVR